MGVFDLLRRVGGRQRLSAISSRANGNRMSAVLVAVDGDAPDSEAVRTACELLNGPNSNLYIVYVIEVERGLALDAEILPATARGEEVLKHMEEVAKPFKINVQAELLQARRAGSAIVQEAVDKHVDAVVIGVPYKEAYGSFSLGQTVPYVLENAPCRVVLWRDPLRQKVPTQ